MGVFIQIEQFPLIRIREMNQFVTVGTYPIVARHTVFACFIVMIVQTFTPIGNRAIKQRHQADALHLGGNLHTRRIEKGRAKINVLRQLFCPLSRTDDGRPACNKRHSERLFIHPAFVVPTVFTEIKALIRTVDDQCVFRQTRRVQVIEHSPDIFIHRGHASQIILDIPLIFPANQIFTRKIGFTKRLVFRLVSRIPLPTLLGRHPSQFRIFHGPAKCIRNF